MIEQDRSAERKKKSRLRAAEDACDKAILETLNYKAVFKCSVSLYQLATFLITDKKFDYKVFLASVNRLKKSKRLVIKDQRIYLPGIKPYSWNMRFSYSRQQIDKNTNVFKVLGFIPWLRFVGVTGSVAAFNSCKGDDIDVFIITQRRRLWLSRLFVYLFLRVIGKYPVGKNRSDKFCTNIFVTEDNMSWPLEKQNLYVASDILLMQPVLNRNDTYFRFIENNSWVFGYFGQSRFDFAFNYGCRVLNQSMVVDVVEKVAMLAQQFYMKSKITTELIKSQVIHFNKNDNTEKILNSYEKLLRKNTQNTNRKKYK